MLKQALEVFKKEYDLYGDDLILDEYIPADGTYIIVDKKDGDFIVSEKIDIKYDKKNRVFDRTISSIDNIKFICFADYYSKLIDMNKPIDVKKVIHSNNYLSFYIKKESAENGKLTIEIIDNYYNLLKDISKKYKGKKKSFELYEKLEKEIGKVDKELIDSISVWIKENIFTIINDYSQKNYLKIYFKFSKQEYIREGSRYLIPNIYNSTDYNEIIDKEVFGFPNDNLNLNAKKPFLENKSRKVSTPYLINSEEALLQKKFFDYLMNKANAGKYNIYIDDKIKALKNDETPDKKFTGMYMRVAKVKKLEIHDYDIISNFTPELLKEFHYKNILNVDYEKLKGDYKPYRSCRELHDLLNEVLFNKFLINNYFTKANDISLKDNNLVSNLLVCRRALFDWFYKGKNNDIWHVLNKVTDNIIKGSIQKGYTTKSLDQFNLRISLKEYFEGGESMSEKLIYVTDTLRDKINLKTTSYIEDDNEYYFAIGQLVSYFISQNKGKNKPLSLAKPFINAKDNSYIRARLKALYNKYDYAIDYSKSKRFKNLYTMVLMYITDSKVNSDMVIAGYLHSNLLYESTKIDTEQQELKD